MCRRVVCSECGRPGFAGCGKHIEQVLGDVPPEDRCRCTEAREERQAKEAGASLPWGDRIRKIFG
ncbi:MAG: hypothetical protein NDJ92_04385 [Thermoanaerobaculia bacterium]|nr:hypothetical protein [Thermoanaerobaculia bacterium]